MAMRQEATRSTEWTRRAPHRGNPEFLKPRWLAVLTAGILAWTALNSAAQAGDPAPLYHIHTAKLPAPIKQVMALTCPGLAPSEMVDWPQRPGTPAPSSSAPAVPAVMIVDEQGHRSRVLIQDNALLVEPLGTCKPPERVERAQLIDGARVGEGTGFIAEAWIAVPTLTYRHGILGDVVTGSELRATNRQGEVLRYRLPDDAVFEDRLARMVYIDGQDAVLVIRSGLETGAALALYGLDRPATDAAALVPLAQSAAFGVPNEWLNPAGVGDFDGSGHTLIAAVLTPHANGTLVIYQKQGAKLVPRYEAPGFSNHRLYSGQLGMSAVVDANGDGIPDLVIPDATRHALRIVTFAHGKFTELQRIPHDSEIVSNIAAQSLGGNGPSLVYALEDGTVVVATK
jgi:hypothetical protein